MPALVYTLCFVASALCAALLLQGYLRSRTRLLLWSALSFICLAVNNGLVLCDVILFPEANLLPWRYAAALAAVCILIYGFIWEVEWTEPAAFFSGVIAMGFAVCAAFFVRFWGRTRDAFFFVFAVAFILLAVCQALTTLLGLPLEERSWLYLLRLAAFLMIMAAIVAKNLGRR